eukprot:CAMPEP_0172713432 /NCGR_PEP_ID=MMETSP1074-20121228/62412_1 /TAXON_ID=2916 /ORGANISM="Ceratium fusus, Strain PA161109" /LENGTH=238 /DNA_ID=CAMNT_0013537529 /DNA_START=60 /DNA_END=776 /DNA_ORIENTATION=+
MKQSGAFMFLFAMEIRVALAFVTFSPPSLVHAVRAAKPNATAAKSVAAAFHNMSKVQVPSVHPSFVRPIAASNAKPTSTGMKSAIAAVAAAVPRNPQQQRVASKNIPVAISLNKNADSHMQASRLLPIGEGAYQSAEAVAQRTLDSNLDCEKKRWEGCFHKDKADIVDGESYGNLRGAESAPVHPPRKPPAPAPPAGPQVPKLPLPVPNPFEKGSAATCFKGLVFTTVLLSLSVGANS